MEPGQAGGLRLLTSSVHYPPRADRRRGAAVGRPRGVARQGAQGVVMFQVLSAAQRAGVFHAAPPVPLLSHTWAS